MKSASLVLACWSWAFCVAFSGCGDTELPEVNFIGSDPPTGSRVSIGLTYVDLLFDATPRSVTVNGMTTRVENTKAVWEIQDWLDEGDITLAVEWLNQDGSEGKGAVIHYQSNHAPVSPPLIVDSSVYLGDTNVDSDEINRSGITFRFTKDVRPVVVDIRPEGGEPLNWGAAWGRDYVVIRPRTDEDKLLPGKNYVIKVLGLRSNVRGLRDEIIETLDFQLHFSTKA